MRKPLARRELLATTAVAVAGLADVSVSTAPPLQAAGLPAAAAHDGLPATSAAFSVPHPANVATPGNPYFRAVGLPYSVHEAENYASRVRSVTRGPFEFEDQVGQRLS